MISINLFIISIISTIIFGIVDASIFLIGEETFQKQLINKYHFDLPMAELATGGMAASISIFISSFISHHLEGHFKLIENPIIDAFGIILGTIFIILLYKFVLKQKYKNTKN